ncbi:MAG: hypothetical protein L0Y58_23805 [Verrucomicrobia subdivision 3 bacterium]|nr:hypothetical protein [Limisphaerales bacterium]
MDSPPQFAIALFVPDAIVAGLNADRASRALQSGVPELDFIPPPWWEESHTVRLGLVENVEALKH